MHRVYYSLGIAANHTERSHQIDLAIQPFNHFNSSVLYQQLPMIETHTQYVDPIIQKLLSTRLPQSDISPEDELERQHRMYNMLRFSGKYRRMQVEQANETWDKQFDEVDKHPDKKGIVENYRTSQETQIHSNENNLEPNTSDLSNDLELSELKNCQQSVESICTCDIPCTRFILINKCINQSIDTDFTFETQRNSTHNSLARSHTLDRMIHDSIDSVSPNPSTPHPTSNAKHTRHNLFSSDSADLSDESYDALEKLYREDHACRVHFQSDVDLIPERLYPEEKRKAVLQGFLVYVKKMLHCA